MLSRNLSKIHVNSPLEIEVCLNVCTRGTIFAISEQFSSTLFLVKHGNSDISKKSFWNCVKKKFQCVCKFSHFLLRLIALLKHLLEKEALRKLVSFFFFVGLTVNFFVLRRVELVGKMYLIVIAQMVLVHSNRATMASEELNTRPSKQLPLPVQSRIFAPRHALNSFKAICFISC